MLARTLFAASLLCLGATPLWAQSAVDRANAKTRRAMAKRDAEIRD